MNKALTVVFQAAVVLFGLAVLAFLLGEPHVEGRNAHATLVEIYFKDPFLAFVYLGSTPFFVALYRAFRMLGRVRTTGQFSQVTVEDLRAIKTCALVLIGFVAGAMVLILMTGDPDDRPAGLFMSLLVTVGSGVVALVAGAFARAVQKALGRPGVVAES